MVSKQVLALFHHVLQLLQNLLEHPPVVMGKLSVYLAR